VITGRLSSHPRALVEARERELYLSAASAWEIASSMRRESFVSRIRL
jgi:PIN domain nuclease of toxin-antitoxin system